MKLESDCARRFRYRCAHQRRLVQFHSQPASSMLPDARSAALHLHTQVTGRPAACMLTAQTVRSDANVASRSFCWGTAGCVWSPPVTSSRKAEWDYRSLHRGQMRLRRKVCQLTQAFLHLVCVTYAEVRKSAKLASLFADQKQTINADQ